MVARTLRTRLEHELDTRSVGAGVWLYRVTRGRLARLWRRRAVVLTTTGRRTGRPRTVLVQVFPDGPDLYVVAANSGMPRPPGWFFNLRAEPRAVAELDGDRFEVHAELLPPSAAADRWAAVLDVAPDYERYVRRSGRVPPVFRLVRRAPTPLATLHRLAATTGVLAGVGGLVHGIGEVLQGSGPPAGLVLDSWTRGGIAANLGGEPAMTVVPDVLATGVAACAVSVAVVAWSARGLDRRHGPAVLAGLSVLLLLGGGGFGPPVLGLLAALVAATRPTAPVGTHPVGGRPQEWGPAARVGAVLAPAWPVLFWAAVADVAFLVLGSLVTGVVLGVDVSDAFVVGLLVAVPLLPAAALAGRSRPDA